MGNSKNQAKAGLVTLVVLAVIGGCGACTGISHLDRETYRGTVTDKERVIQHRRSKYLIFTELEDNSVRVFQNTDSWLEWKFGSSDMYAGIKKGKMYDFKTYGWRVPFLSWYENIIDAKEVKPGMLQ